MHGSSLAMDILPPTPQNLPLHIHPCMHLLPHYTMLLYKFLPDHLLFTLVLLSLHVSTPSSPLFNPTSHLPDFVPITYEGNKATNGGTIDARTGRVYFTTIEPFGKTLRDKLENESALAPTQIDQIVYSELYDSTKIAAQQIPSKNRFTSTIVVF